MECKSCGHTQDKDFRYCPVCGAKVINHRLTFKNLWKEVLEKVFDLDSNFIKTFRHLFSKPEEVLEGYVNGIRRRYLNPIAYFGIALTLSGIQLYVFRKIPKDKINWDVLDQGVNPETGDKLMNVVFDFNTFIFILYIPIFALAGWLTFNKKSFFPTEHIIFFTYILAHWSIVSFFFLLIALLIDPQSYLALGIPSLALLIIYAIYAMQRINHFSYPQLALRGSVFSLLVVLGYAGIIILMYILMFATGILTLEDFKPVE